MKFKLALVLISTLTITSCSLNQFNQKQDAGNLVSKSNSQATPLKNWNKTNTYNATPVNSSKVNVVSNNISPIAHFKNYNQQNETQVLTQLSSYIRNSNTYLNSAKALQNKNDRYKFNYYYLERDLSEISNSIDRFVNKTHNTQAPRIIDPLIKRY